MHWNEFVYRPSIQVATYVGICIDFFLSKIVNLRIRGQNELHFWFKSKTKVPLIILESLLAVIAQTYYLAAVITTCDIHKTRIKQVKASQIQFYYFQPDLYMVTNLWNNALALLLLQTLLNK